MPANSAAWLGGVAMLALVLFSAGVLGDGDTFSHIAAGGWMIDHRAVLRSDPFSFSKQGAPWVAHEWLAEVVMAAAFRGAGWSGVVVLTALAAGAAFFQLGRHLSRWLPAGAAMLLMVMAAACVTPGMLARPHILALPAFEAWVAGLFVARSRGRAPSWWLVPLMCLWANLHGGFMIGLALAVPLAVEAALAEPARWRLVAVQWGGFLVAATFAALLTPHGVSGLLLPFRMAGMTELSGVSEWRPADFGSLGALELLIVVGLYMGLGRGARLAPLRLLILLGLLHLALQHARHLALVGIIVPLMVAEPLGAALAAGRVQEGAHEGEGVPGVRAPRAGGAPGNGDALGVGREASVRALRVGGSPGIGDALEVGSAPGVRAPRFGGLPGIGDAPGIEREAGVGGALRFGGLPKDGSAPGPDGGPGMSGAAAGCGARGAATRRDAGRARAVMAAGVVAVVALVAVRLGRPVVRVNGPTAPLSALAHVPAALRARPVLNDYAFGGYLIFAGVRPFIDARAELYGPVFLRRYAAVIRPDRQALDGVLGEYGIGWTMLSPGNPAVQLMDGKAGWCRVYADAVAVVHAQCE